MILREEIPKLFMDMPKQENYLVMVAFGKSQNKILRKIYKKRLANVLGNV